MKVLHVAASLNPAWGGPTKVVTELTEALAKKGIEVSIFAPLENSKEICIPKGVDVKLFPKGFLSKFWTSYSSSLAKALMKEVFDFDLVHIHEIWHHPHYAAYKATKLARKPFVITIHGALDPWCLNHKAFRKRVYATLIQKRILKEASGLHAITEEEVKSMSNFVNNQNIFLIPNGLNPEDFENLPERSEIELLYPGLKRKKVILFLGRIHPIKGLDLLAKAFGKLARTRNDIILLIVGPDNYGYAKQVKQMLKIEGVMDKVIFTGILTGHMKLSVLSRADIFVLPSYSEGFSMAILEAMICGLPVIITRQCNFPEVESVGAGKVIDPDVISLSKAMIELVDNPELCKDMGSKGKRLVMEKYIWDKIADQMIIAAFLGV